jgi:hypothetical protein
MPEKKQKNPTKALMKTALTAWKMSMLGTALPYKMTRTFAHHKRGEQYDTKIIFEELQAINLGNHKELIEQFEAFEKTVLTDLDKYLEEHEGE